MRQANVAAFGESLRGVMLPDRATNVLNDARRRGGWVGVNDGEGNTAVQLRELDKVGFAARAASAIRSRFGQQSEWGMEAREFVRKPRFHEGFLWKERRDTVFLNSSDMWP